MTALSTLDLQDLERKHGPNLTTSKIIPVEPNGEPNAALSKSQRAKVLWNTFVDNCTLHGLYYAFHSRTTFRKLVWAFFVLAGVSWFIFQSSKLLTKYFSYPISTKVTLEHESLPAFPAVTICNFNVFKRSVLPKWYHKIIEHVIKSNEGVDETFDWSKVNLTAMNMTKNYLVAGHRMEDMLWDCQWRKHACSHANFTQTLTTMGLCHTFNSGTCTTRMVLVWVVIGFISHSSHFVLYQSYRETGRQND